MAISLKERFFRFNRLGDLLFVGFITSIGVSLLNGVWALYFFSFFKSNSLVGFFSSILSVIAILSFFIFNPVIERYQENKIYSLALFFSTLILIALSINENFYLFVILTIVYVMLGVLRADTFGIMYREESKTKAIGANEGMIYSLSNLGWIIGALLLTILLGVYGINNIFFFASIFIIISFIIFMFYKRKIKKPKYTETNLIKDIKNFFTNKELVKLYISSLGTSFWLGFIFVYIPLYIVQNGFSRSFVGLFLFTFLLPFLIEYFVGKKSDVVGSRIFITLGYLISGVFTVLAYFTNQINIVLLLLVLGCFGIAMTSPTREIHFFKVIKKIEKERYYGIFLTHIEVSLLLGKIIPAVILVFAGFKLVFLVVGLSMFVFSVFSLKLKDI